jgi:hypothetical protein
MLDFQVPELFAVLRLKDLFKPRKMRLYSFKDSRSFESLYAFESLYIFSLYRFKSLRHVDSVLLNDLHGVMFHPDKASGTCKF